MNENAKSKRERGGIVDRLLDIAGNHAGEQQTAEEAADMLEFLLGQFQMHSPKMDGQHSYRFRTGWPWTHARGPTAEDAIRNAMAESKADREKGRRGE